MVTKIQRWGNSQGLRFPKEILRKIHLSVGDEVEISVKSGEIIVRPAAQVRGKYKLKDLVSAMPVKYTPEEDWGRPLGKEVW